MPEHVHEPPVQPVVIPRRTLFQKVFLGITIVVGLVAIGMFLVPFFLFVVGPLPKRKAQWVNLGPIGKFPKGETRLATFNNPLGQSWDGVTARTGVYVRNLGKDSAGEDTFVVFSVNCAHLGCPVEWFPQSRLFMCPCHGGVYYENGERAAGPPPRGLFQVNWQVRNGRLEIQAPHYPTLHNTLKDKA